MDNIKADNIDLPNLNPIEEFFGELKIYIRKVWNKYKGFIKVDFLSFLEECVTVVDSQKASTKKHFYCIGISIIKPIKMKCNNMF